MVETAGAIAGIVSAVLDVGKCFMSLFNHKSNISNLETEVGKLKVARDKVKGKIEVARNKAEKIEETVEQWVIKVNSIVDEAEMLINGRANVRCFNLEARYKQSREALTKVKDVSKFLQLQEAFGDQVSRPIIHEDTRLILNKDYLAFQSRSSTLKDVLKALNEGEVDIIGVHGMGGIGKTTLVREVGRQAKEDTRFDNVIFVEVTDTPNIEKIREEIANDLGLKFDDKENETERRNKLFARMKQEKTILIILDNIWDELDLEKLGIPFGENHKGCKLLLTARDRNVLDKMGSKSFSIDVLKREEAWSLFRKMTGGFDMPELQSLPNDVCQECGGLPIAIVTVAKALRNKRELADWKNALQELKNPSPTEFKGVLKEAYSKIALSYNYLEGEELKKVFSLCSIMTHDASISKLFKFVMGLNILEGNKLTMEGARHRLHTLLSKLRESCLLLDCSSRERFSMHDVVRDIAITISYKDRHVLTERNDVEDEWKNVDILKKCTQISLASGDMISKHWAEGLECPELEFFYLGRKYYSFEFCYTGGEQCSSFKFPENFFSRMEKLKVLSLKSFPSSISLPMGLQTLCLDGSEIGELAIIGGLKKLKILSLSYCYNIKQLPGEISQLTQLRLLDLSNCYRLRVITPNVISALVRLEELYVVGCSVLWEAGGPNVKRNNASLEELLHLSGLTALEIDIKDEKILPKGFFSEKLERYSISVGDACHCDRGYHGGDSSIFCQNFKFIQNKCSRRIKMKLNSSICLEELQRIKNVESLCLDKLQNIKNGLQELDNDGFSQLKHLHVKDNRNLLCLVDSTKCETAFPLLESLILFNMINLEKICKGQPTTESFCNLKFIKVHRCDELTILFPFSTAKILSQLQGLEVEDCKNVKEIFAIEREGNVNNGSDKIEFFQLRFLTLKHLPRLASFCSGMTTTSTSQLRHDELTLFDEKLVFSNLEALEVEDIESEMIWCSPTFITSFYHKLTSLSVLGCRKLKYIFPASMVKSFKHLQHLQICRCRDLKEIIANGAEETPKSVFPRLKFLKLDNLQELTTFYPGRHTLDWRSLEKLEICDCKKVKIFTSECGSSNENNTEAQFDNSKPTLFLIEKINHNLKKLIVDSLVPLGILRRFNNLEKLKLKGDLDEVLWACKEEEMPRQIKHLELDHLYQLKYLWKKDCNLDPVLLFQNLTHLRVTDCHKIEMNLITTSVARSLLQLREMSIRRCNMIIEVVEDERDATKDEIDFPKLKSLSLYNLENLVCFYSGNYILKFPSLEELKVLDCCNMKTFSQGVLSAPKLQKVVEGYKEKLLEGDLNSAIQQIFEKKQSYGAKKNIKQIWRGQVPNEPEADQVKDLEIFKDKSTSIPVEIIKMFHKLENLVLKASSYKELFSCGDDDKCAGAFTQLKILEVLHCHDLITLLPSSTSFENLTTLKVQYCKGLGSLLTSSTAKSLVRLKEMTIKKCEMLKEVVANGGDVEKDVLFRKLKSLSLDCLENLTSFCSGNNNFKFLSLNRLIVHDCPKMETFSGGVLSTPKLEKVERYEYDLNGCWDYDLNTTIKQLQKMVVFPDMRYTELMPLMGFAETLYDIQLPMSTSSSYRNITRLILKGFQKLKCIFSSSLVKGFEQLRQLEIIDCAALKEIVSMEEVETTSAFVFPWVTFLKFENLPELATFCFGRHTSEWPLLQKLQVFNCEKVKTFTSECGSSNEDNTEAQFDISKPALFLIEKINPDLKELIVDGMISLGILQRFNNLEKLKLDGSSNKVLFSCKEDCKLDSILLFQNLTHLEVTRCHGILMNLITPSVVKSLLQLREMAISECNMIIEVVEDERDAAQDEIDFPKLKSLSLDDLENLACFYSGNCILKFPSLEELQVTECPNMKTFSQGVLNAPKLQKVEGDWGEWLEGDLNSTIQQVYKKKDPKALTLIGKDIKQICRGQILDEPEVDDVKDLVIAVDESRSIPVEILETFHNVKNLKLKASSYKELFSCGDEDKCVGTFTQLKFLEVFFCHNLTTLVPSSTSFENLKTLKVQYCNGLRSLLTSSTAKSLVRLQDMTIKQCEMLTKVVANGADEVKDVVFKKLERLSLDCLENLTSFCSGNYTFKFLSLERLNVHNCPKMETFSGGILSTPKLQKLERHDDLHNYCYWDDDCYGFWDYDLNTTIRQLQKMVIFPDTKVSKQSSTLWDIQRSTSTSFSYRNITHLILCGFNNLKYIFPSSLVKSFEQLQQLEIRKCDVLKEIVTMDGVETTSTFVFPRVTILKLEFLPELTSFYPGKHTSEWPVLTTLEVCNCKKVKTFTSEHLSFHENSEEAHSLLLVEKINSNLEALRLTEIDSVMTWQGPFSENFFSKLKLLEIMSTNAPVGILQRFKNLEMVKLNRIQSIEIFLCGEDEKTIGMPTHIRGLKLNDCDKLEYLWKQDSKIASILQNLEILEVYWCRKLINVGPSSASFQNLKVLTVANCRAMVNLITSSAAKSLVQLTEMKIRGCSKLIEIVENDEDGAEDEIIFTKLKWLSLENLESLTCFCMGKYTFKFPTLEELIVEDCPNMKTFCEGVLSTPRLQKVWEDKCLDIGSCLEGELNTIIQQLHRNVVHSNSKILVINGKDITPT